MISSSISYNKQLSNSSATRRLFSLAIVLLFTVCSFAQTFPVIKTGSVTPMPKEWIDQDTRHKIIHLVPREGSNQSFYFHNNPFIPGTGKEKDKMVFYGKVGNYNQLFTVELMTGQVKQVTGKPRVTGEIVGKKNREVFYQCGDSVFATKVESLATRLIYVFPDTMRGHISTLNADETLLAGTLNSDEERELFRKNPAKSDYFNVIYEAKLLRTLFIIDIKTGNLKKIYSEKAWLNHVQFSTVDPHLLMYCHEGPWHKVDRIWTIDVTIGNPRLMHKRTVDREIAGHEFFSRDGKTVWFDLQVPRSENFFLAGININSGVENRYALTRDEWSIHYNISPDQKFFAGDGGDPGQVAKAKDGMWMYLFTPEGDHLRSERLVNMKQHNYKLEPDNHFSPDGKWVIFRANFEGHPDIYAVEITKSE